MKYLTYHILNYTCIFNVQKQDQVAIEGNTKATRNQLSTASDVKY